MLELDIHCYFAENIYISKSHVWSSVSLTYFSLIIPANSPYFGRRLLILTSNICKIDKHNFFIIYNFKKLASMLNFIVIFNMYAFTT